MRKALLFIIFITALPVVASAEALHLLFPVQSSAFPVKSQLGTDNSSYSKGVSTDAISLRYIGNSGIGIGFTNLNQRVVRASGKDRRLEGGKDLEYQISFRALELSYTLGYLTFGLGSPIDGRMDKNDGSSSISSQHTRVIYKVSGSTAFAELALKIYDKGSLLIGYHMSSLKFTSSSDSESATLSNIMLGFRIPI